MIRARSARLRRVVAARTHVVSCARSLAATANFVATAMPSLHHAIIRMASELTRRDTSSPEGWPSGTYDHPCSALVGPLLLRADVEEALPIVRESLARRCRQSG